MTAPALPLNNVRWHFLRVVSSVWMCHSLFIQMPSQGHRLAARVPGLQTPLSTFSPRAGHVTHGFSRGPVISLHRRWPRAWGCDEAVTSLTASPCQRSGPLGDKRPSPSAQRRLTARAVWRSGGHCDAPREEAQLGGGSSGRGPGSHVRSVGAEHPGARGSLRVAAGSWPLVPRRSRCRGFPS